MNNRQGTAYDAHKATIHLHSLIDHGDLTTKEHVSAKQALDVANKIYNRRKTEVEK